MTRSHGLRLAATQEVLVVVPLPFANRVEAGEALADELLQRNDLAHTLVLALPRGGVPVAFAIARRLRAPLDVLVVRKIGVPWQPELAMGAVAVGAPILNQEMIRTLDIPREQVDAVVTREVAELRRREELYRRGRSPLDMKGRPVILVDDGLATGSTMLAAVRCLRDLNPAKIIVAVPVGSDSAVTSLRNDGAEVLCLAMPKPFRAVGEWYRDFTEVSDGVVQRLLEENAKAATYR